MGYPWAGFSSFLFTRDEIPIFGTDMGWQRLPSIDRARPLGSATDSIVTTAAGSATRAFELYLDPTRLAALEALVNTTGTFTDWERPTPDTRSAFLRALLNLERLAVKCHDGVTRQRFRVRVELISQ
jgi:fructose-1,6-bisphosphatase/inositol monophosphatase family enzyme